MEKSVASLISTTQKLSSLIRDEDEIYHGNRILLIHEDGRKEFVSKMPQGFNIINTGKNSLVVINLPYKVKNKVNLWIGEGGYAYIGKNFMARFPMNINMNNVACTLYIDDYANFGSCHIFAGDEKNLEIVIGKHFLAALGLIIRASDGHSIISLKDKRIINIPKFGVHIGNHVWCGQNVILNKDSHIPDDCVVASGAIVGKKDFIPHSILGGVPAKVIKSDITWDSKNIARYLESITYKE